jgi:hypothetical protein
MEGQWWIVAAAVILALAGCGTPGDRPASGVVGGTTAQPQQTLPAQAGDGGAVDPSQIDDPIAAAADFAARVEAVMAQGDPPRSVVPQSPREPVAAAETLNASPADDPGSASHVAPSEPGANANAAVSVDTSTGPTADDASPPAAGPELTLEPDPFREPLTRVPTPSLVDELARRAAAAVSDEDRSLAAALTRAAASGVGLAGSAGGGVRLDEDHDQAVSRFGQLVATASQHVMESDDPLDRRALTQRLDEAWGEQPIEIVQLQLCRRVDGFGDYVPFEQTTYLAGQPQRMIVYVELENFASQPTENDRHEVRLQQRVQLFTSADGTMVWEHEPVRISDTSRNIRRDFFVVQVIELPARLNVGSYLLKVEITDLHGGSMFEQNLPIELVADESLAQ